jgi:hypothetical protein
MVYDNGQRDVPIEATVSFWVIPWRVVGAGAVILIAAPLFASLYIKSRRRVKKLEAELKKHNARKVEREKA